MLLVTRSCLVLGVAALLTACSGGALTPAPDAATPGVVERAMAQPKPSVIDQAPSVAPVPRDQLTATDGTAGSGGKIVAAARTNEFGELWTLDDAAAQACAQAEFALTALTDQRDAAPLVSKAVSAAAGSKTATVRSAAEALDRAGATDRDALVGLLQACTRGGYEL